MSLCLNSSDGINEMGLPLRTKDEICDKVTQTQRINLTVIYLRIQCICLRLINSGAPTLKISYQIIRLCLFATVVFFSFPNHISREKYKGWNEICLELLTSPDASSKLFSIIIPLNFGWRRYFDSVWQKDKPRAKKRIVRLKTILAALC